MAETLNPALASPTVLVFENHDEAYYAWKQQNFHGRTLLHFDAHIDFEWITPDAAQLLAATDFQDIHAQIENHPVWNLTRRPLSHQLHIGNYIHQAIREKMLREFIWVYPDDADSQKQFYAVDRILKALTVSAIGPFEVQRGPAPGCFRGKIYGTPFQALPFSAIHQLESREDYLLDIDTDFFIVQSLYSPNYPFTDLSRPKPWLTPENFLRTLEGFNLRSPFITIAYSVEGGYTPVSLKFLGEELYFQFNEPWRDPKESRFGRLHDAIMSERSSARQLLKEGIELFPNEAAYHFALSRLYSEAADWPEARAHYAAAITCDPSYRTAFNHPGPVYHIQQRDDLANASYAELEQLDPEHPDLALYKLEQAVTSRNAAKAIQLGESLLQTGFDHEKLRCLLAEAYGFLGLWEKAWAQLEECVPTNHSVKFSYYLTLKAKVARKRGDRRGELTCYQDLLRHRIQSPKIHFRMALLYWQLDNSYKFRRHFLKGLRIFFLQPFYRLQHRCRMAWGK